ncbi:uncharacterized protein LOC127112050 [Lathyrus oleraceus]|uniref:uncharacterized protein LOC127112050 n=1 Tax=Pisum sativum TaxID=3888 RepID=UPI0021CF925B|nr:uncharacterized protein LOC127112050 [Pisum sativum]
MASASAKPIFKDGEAQGDGIWETVKNGLHNPTSVINGVGTPKIKSSYDEDDKKKIRNEKKAINILQSALSINEFFRISQWKSAKEIWDTLVETHEGTTKVKRSILNTLSQEYEMFRMQPGESIVALQKRFVHLTNHLIALGKTFTNDDLNLKMLRSLTREWQPKVAAISEKKSLSTMTSASLFGKLQEHELELGRLKKHENQEKKSKGIALKVDSKEDRNDGVSEEDANFMLLQGHIKSDCPKLSKKGGFKGKKDFKNKKAYVAWEDNEISSSSKSESDECANLTLMASHHSDDEEDEVSNEFSLFDSDAQGATNELLEECKILYTWTFFLVQKNDAFKAFKKYAKQVQNEKSLTIASIRSDHGGEFQNASFKEFCEEHGIFHNFSAPRTPQQNGAVERKNRSLVELA